MGIPKRKTNAVSSSGPVARQKAAPTAVFAFLESISDKTVPTKYVTYKPARLVKTSSRWYVEYYYRSPQGKWKRFRVFENINRIKTDEYASILVDATNEALANGLNPFASQPEPIKEWSLNIALDKFLEHSKENGLRGKTLQTYGTVVNFVKDHFIKDNSLYKPITWVGKEHIKDFMQAARARQGWNNNTYNNYLRYLKTFFNWLVKEEKITKNPCSGLELKKVAVSKHKYYTDAIADQLRASMEKANPYLLKFCSFIYYTATRPKSEARLLQCKHVLFDRKLLFIPASISKNKKDDYIPMSEELITILKEMGVDNSDKYIFSAKGRPDDKPASQNYFASLFKPFKDKLGLTEDYTLYGWKHLRAIHLIHDGVQPYELMKLFRHSDLSTTSIYLRELGLTVNAEAINSKTRKF